MTALQIIYSISDKKKKKKKKKKERKKRKEIIRKT